MRNVGSSATAAFSAVRLSGVAITFATGRVTRLPDFLRKISIFVQGSVGYLSSFDQLPPEPD
jgi:hypothetical protein